MDDDLDLEDMNESSHSSQEYFHTPVGKCDQLSLSNCHCSKASCSDKLFIDGGNGRSTRRGPGLRTERTHPPGVLYSVPEDHVEKSCI